MKRSHLVAIIALAVIVLVSLFAPAPVSRTVQAEKRNACEGLRNAYSACRANNPNTDKCLHIREQLLSHGCLASSGGGHTSGSR